MRAKMSISTEKVTTTISHRLFLMSIICSVFCCDWSTKKCSWCKSFLKLISLQKGKQKRTFSFENCLNFSNITSRDFFFLDFLFSFGVTLSCFFSGFSFTDIVSIMVGGLTLDHCDEIISIVFGSADQILRVPCLKRLYCKFAFNIIIKLSGNTIVDLVPQLPI